MLALLVLIGASALLASSLKAALATAVGELRGSGRVSEGVGWMGIDGGSDEGAMLRGGLPGDGAEVTALVMSGGA